MKRIKVFKCTILYSLIYIVIFALYLGIYTSCIMRNSTFIEPNEEGDISYQSVNSKNESNIIIWNSEMISDRVVRVDEGRNRFKIIDDTYCDGQIYFQYSYYNKKNKETYGIGIYDLHSKEVSLSDMKGFEAYQWESICKKDNKVYMLLNNVDDMSVQEYRIKIKGKVLCELEQEYKYPEGSYILDTVYYNGNIYMCLDDGTTYYYSGITLVKNDDIDKDIFNIENTVVVNKASKILGCNLYGDIFVDKLLLGIIAFVITGFIIICLAISRSFVLKLLVWVELGVVVIVTITMAGITDRIEKNEIDKLVEYGSGKLEPVTSTINASGYAEYQKLYKYNNQLEKQFDEIIVINKNADVLSLAGGLGIPLDAEIPEQYAKLANKVDDILSKRLKSGNTEYLAIVIGDTSDIKEKSIVIGIFELSDVRETVSNIMSDVMKRTIIILLVVNVFMISIFIYYSIGFKRFSNALLNLVKKHDDFESVKNSNKDLSREYSALDEINRIFSNVRYEKNQNFELYNRYIPKDVEKILGRKSLLDVELGDSVEFMGSVTTINMDDDNFMSSDIYMHTIQNAYEIMNTNRKKKNGIIVSQDSRMSDTKILFKDDLNSAIEFAIDTIHGFDSNINVADKQKIIVVNYSKYQCGITGCEERLIPYLFSKDETIISNYLEALRRAGIKLILTEKAVEKADKKYMFRYIGYIAERGNNIKIYECLDAYSPIKRNLLINTQAKFKKALGLFYSNDFYLARNTFNEVLKENPDDKIARWYLFNCENNLNNSSDDKTSYGLFENKIFEQQYQI